MNAHSAVPGLNREDVYEIVRPVPPTPEQQRIAKILSDLDSKIELNNQISKSLEAIGEAIFEHWFVDFEFPNLDREPYKSTGGKFVSADNVEVPEGWSVKSLRAIADARRGFSYNGREKHDSFGDFVFITLNNIAKGGGFKPNYSWITTDRLKDQQMLSENDLVIANTHFGVGGSNVGRLLACPAIVFFPNNYAKRTGAFSHHITKIVPFDQRTKYFLYFFFKATHEENASKYRTGTSVAGLDIDNFMKNRFVLEPPAHILEAFNSITKPIFSKLAAHYKQNVVIAGIRDSLLPKLMSGKVRVPVEVG